MQIRLLKYNQIDFAKYNFCIENSFYSRVEAYSWYLDITTKKAWHVYVYGDYEVVMPVFSKRTKKNVLKKKVVQPMYSQQLGFFSKNKIEDALKKAFLECLSRQKVISSQLNVGCLFESDQNLTAKVNFELQLNKPYQELYVNYGKGLKSNLKKAKKASLEISTDIGISQLLEFKQDNASNNFSVKNRKILTNLLIELNKRKFGTAYTVYLDKELISCCYIIKSNNRLIYLSSTTNNIGKKVGANSFILDKVIEKHSNSSYVLDFEGSSVKGIAQFFKSFGSVNNPYVEFSNE